jgi:hypothetical protein
LEIVELSPLAASRKEKDTWLGLFDANAWIEDPAGTTPYYASDPVRGLDMFYDIFIAHSEVSFVSLSDYISGYTAVRDGTIYLDIGNGRRVDIPAFLRYEVTDSGKIMSLRAYWKPGQAVFRALGGSQPEGFRYLTAAGKRLFEAQGLKGIGRFALAAINTEIGARMTVLKLKEYLESGRYSDAVALFSHIHPGEVILHSDKLHTYPPGYLTLGELKMLQVDKLIESRNSVSFRCDVMLEGRKRSGVAFCRLAYAGFRIRTLEFFFSRHPAND